MGVEMSYMVLNGVNNLNNIFDNKLCRLNLFKSWKYGSQRTARKEKKCSKILLMIHFYTSQNKVINSLKLLI